MNQNAVARALIKSAQYSENNPRPFIRENLTGVQFWPRSNSKCNSYKHN